ncbi:MAG: ABC transporter permease [Phycisphaerae bacterium]|nr:ABC transporter permease [Phycisphaerae bacterium]
MSLVRRLLMVPVILLVIYTLTLTLAWAVPGSPMEHEGRRPPPEVQRALERQYNLDSFGSFYRSYLLNATGLAYLRDRWNGTLADEELRARDRGQAPPERPVFDLGPSLQYEDWRVNEILASSFPVSAAVGLTSIVIALAIGLSAGVIGAARPGSWADGLSLTVALAGISLPSFVIGAALLMLPGALGIPAVGGWGTLSGLLLPAFTLSLAPAAYIARLTRMGMLEAMDSDYVRTARAKGCSERRVLLGHALKNAFLPVLSYLGPASAMAMTGSFVVEKVFSVPGLGQHFVNAVLNKDLFLIIAVVMIYSTMLILLNLAVDALYRWADPRTA